MLNYIPDDGYSERGYIASFPGLYGEMRFRYRPMLTEVRQRIVANMKGMTPDQEVVRTCELMSAQLVEWDLKDPKGSPVPVSPQVTRRLKPSLLWKLWGIILGTEPSDHDDKADEEEQREQARLVERAIEGPAPIGTVREEADAKNSEQG